MKEPSSWKESEKKSPNDKKKIDWQEKVKEIGPMKLVILIIAGILLLIISCGDFFASDKKENEPTNSEQMTEAAGALSNEEYGRAMEQKIEELLGRVQGVGKVDVMITLSASKEKVALKDNETDSSKTQEASVIVEDSDRNSSPYIIQEKEPVPEGILVVCEGGGEAQLVREIIGAIQVLFNVEAHKIKVMKMEP